MKREIIGIKQQRTMLQELNDQEKNVGRLSSLIVHIIEKLH